ncbi:MAG TPA: PDZ domain-containing protein [Thermoanaerobaculia bacterium]|nr:PDZ domain-containing protein [Thermoanaerobaculia bacterium]
MFHSISRTIVVALLVAASTALAEEPKCTASPRECDLEIRQMLKGGRRYFGAMVEETHPGLVVKAVNANSPAEAAGLKKGDRLITMNDRSLTQASFKEYKQLLHDASKSGKVFMIVWRRGAYKKLETRLEPYTKEQIEKIIAAHIARSHPVTSGAQ